MDCGYRCYQLQCEADDGGDWPVQHSGLADDHEFYRYDGSGRDSLLLPPDGN
jgi:hypothetical protein